MVKKKVHMLYPLEQFKERTVIEKRGGEGVNLVKATISGDTATGIVWFQCIEECSGIKL